MKPGSKDPEAGCHCPSCEVLRRKCRERKRLAKMGRPATITEAEAERARAHVNSLMAVGLTSRAVEARSSAGVRKVVDQIRMGRPTPRMQRCTYEALLSVKPIASFEDMPSPKGGPRTSSIGSTRRLQGMAQRGFNTRWMAHSLDMAECTVQLILTGQQKRISRKTHEKIKYLFKVWSVRDPFEWRIAPVKAIKYRIRLSKEAGYAPSAAWDDDTMDNPRYQAKGLIKENS